MVEVKRRIPNVDLNRCAMTPTPLQKKMNTLKNNIFLNSYFAPKKKILKEMYTYKTNEEIILKFSITIRF